MSDHRALLVEAAERWGTPLYVTDLDRAADAASAWTDALPGALVAYAVKANPDPALLRRLARDEIGAEVVGPVELELALRAGMTPERIVVNGVGLTDAELAAASRAGALVNAETTGGLHALLASGARRIGLRINPGIGAETHAHLVTGAAESKFGIALDELAQARAMLESAGVRPTSVGAHIGSGIDDPAPFARLADRMVTLADDMDVNLVNLGGGFTGRPRDWADAVLPRISDPSRLIVEPGRTIVRDAGWLLTRVTRVQARGHLVVDAGMTELLRPVLYGARHPVQLLAAGATLPDRRSWMVSGPICEAGDVVAHDVDLGRTAGEGALLAVEEAGAYGLSMVSTYNGRLRPAQAVIERGAVRLSRRRETLDDAVARDVERG